jgi:hypothetical protein
VENSHHQLESSSVGIIAFNRMEHALKAEKFLKGAGFSARVVVPPQLLDTGCNLGVLFDFSKLQEVERLLKEKRAEYTHIGMLKECQ